jgi:hypothetical protein
VAARSKTRTAFARSNTEIVGSNPTGGMDVCVCVYILCLPRVEAGKNTSTVIPACRKRRREGNPVVSGETVPADLKEKVNEDLSLYKPLQVMYRITAN